MKYRMIFAILVLITMPPLTGTVSGYEQKPIDHSFSFDRDLDRIDDSLKGEGPFHVVIHLETGTSPFEVERDLIDSCVSVETVFDEMGFITAVLPDTLCLRTISRLDGIEVIESQVIPSLFMDTSVPGIKASRSSEYSPETAHELGFIGRGETIAIIDTGVDNEHPMLEGSFVAGLDLTIPSTPLSPRDGSFDPDDRSGHGTAVASVALGREYEDIVGAAPGAGLIDIKIVTSLSQDINPFTDEFLTALQWIMDNQGTDWGDGYSGVDIVSISLGLGPTDGAMSEAVTDLISSGIVVVQAAGNSNGPYSEQGATSWPDNSIIVGGIDNKDTVIRSDDEAWTVSTSGPRTDDGDDDPFDELKPDVTAPSVNIQCAAHSTTSNVQPATGFSTGTGTSYAAPHAAGTIAMMLEANPDIRPDATGNPVMLLIHKSAEARGVPFEPETSDKYDTNYGWGILDSYRAVLAARSYSTTNHRPQITSFTAQPDETTTGSKVTLKVIAEDIDEDPLTYELEVDDGVYTGSGPEWEWTAPDEPGDYSFQVTVTDPDGASDQRRTSVTIIEGDPNRSPVITSFFIKDDEILTGGSSKVTTVANDPDGDPLEYEYDTIKGTIQGSGDTVTYIAPQTIGTDTISVRVIDDKGASTSEELIVTIVEEQVNSPPTIVLLTLAPPVVNNTNLDDGVLLTAMVEDPDGRSDISLVIADLSSISGSSGERMFDDGTNGDNTSSDGIFSVMVPLPGSPVNGIYRFTVKAYDSEDAESNATIELSIDIGPSGTVESGSSSGRDMTLIAIVLVIVFIIVIIVGGIIMVRGKKKKRQVTYSHHPSIGQVRYRPSGPTAPPIQAMPSQQQPKFNVVQRP